MKLATHAVTLVAPARDVFDYLADATNLPNWAVGFCRTIRGQGDAWIVGTAQGEVALRLVTDRRLGVIDSYMTPMTPEPAPETPAFSRVVALPEGSAYVFTMVQSPGMPDEAFAAQETTLVEELELLRHLIKARHTCPA